VVWVDYGIAWRWMVRIGPKESIERSCLGRILWISGVFWSRLCPCRAWFMSKLFVLDLICLAFFFSSLVAVAGVVGTWICLYWRWIYLPSCTTAKFMLIL
jgi:hypothetical protein